MVTLIQESGFGASLEGVRRPVNDIEFIVSHPDGRIVDANDRAVAAYGYPREVFVGLHIDAIRRADPDEAKRQRARVVEENAVVFEAVHYRSDGTSFPVEVSCREFVVEGRSYLHSLVRDIAARRQAEADRRFLATLVGQMQDAVIVTDADRRIKAWAGAAEAMFGWTPAEAIGQLASDLFYPDGHDEELQPLAGAPARWVPLRLQHTPAHKDGHRIHVTSIFTPLRDDAGRVVGRLAVARDVGRERAIEQALRDSKNRLSLVLEGSSEGFWDRDVASGQIFLSARCREILGDPAEDIVVSLGTTLARMHQDDVAATMNVLDQAMVEASGTLDAEFRMRCRDGSWKWVSARGRAVELDASGRPTRIAGTLTDVSLRKKADEDLMAAADANERLVGELRQALASVKTLTGLLPICAWCGKVRSDQGYWQRIEAYLVQHTDARVSHGMCPECLDRFEVGPT